MNAPLRHPANDLRRHAEAAIELLLGLVDELVQDLDRLDVLTEDMELEPDVEEDADSEPWLGSLARIDQRAWSFGNFLEQRF
jgi:hypothetical protein